MKLYPRSLAMTISTSFLLIGLIGYIVYTFMERGSIQYWGRRTLFLAVYGWVICCFAAERDGLDKTIQNAIDGSCAPGIFNLVSFPTIIGCVCAAPILISIIGALVSKSQHTREIMYFIMSGSMFLKMFTIEVGRVLIR